MARKSKYDPETFPLLAEGFAREGLSDEQIAKKLNISISIYYDYQNRFKYFLEAIKRGKAPVDTKVENAVLKRALGYNYVETTTEYTINPVTGEKIIKSKKEVTKHVNPDVTAQIFWLCNRKPDNWRRKDAEDKKQDIKIVVSTKSEDDTN